MGGEDEEVKLIYSIYKKVDLDNINTHYQDGYSMSRTERFVLEKLTYTDMKKGYIDMNDYDSMEKAMAFIDENRKELQYMKLVILPEVKIPWTNE